MRVNLRRKTGTGGKEQEPDSLIPPCTSARSDTVDNRAFLCAHSVVLKVRIYARCAHRARDLASKGAKADCGMIGWHGW